MKKKVWLLVSLFFIVVAVVLPVACGGGGGGSSTTAPSNTPATIDADTGAEALAMLKTIVSTTEDVNAAGEIFSLAAGGDASGQSILTPVMKLFFNSGAGFQALGSLQKNEDCDHDGAMEMDFTWDGDDDADECEMENLHGTYTFTACAESSESHYDGVIEISSTGQVCKPGSITMHYINFSAVDESAGINVSAPDFTIAMTDFVYDEDDDLSGYKMTLNGKVTATYDEKQYTVECSNLVCNVSWTESQTTMSIDGQMSGPCLDGWVTLTTNQAVVIPEGSGDDDTCPIAGQLTISGNGETVLTFNSDGSVEIGDQHYDSCNDVPEPGC